MPDAGVKKLNHGWRVKGIRTPKIVSGKGDSWLPVLGIRPLLHGAVYIEFPLRSDSWWVMVSTCVPPCPAELGGTCLLRSRPPVSIAGYCILMQNKFPKIYWDVQRNQLSLQYVHSGWMISCHFSLTRWETERPWLWAVSSASLVGARRKGQRWSWAPSVCAVWGSAAPAPLSQHETREW